MKFPTSRRLDQRRRARSETVTDSSDEKHYVISSVTEDPSNVLEEAQRKDTTHFPWWLTAIVVPLFFTGVGVFPTYVIMSQDASSLETQIESLETEKTAAESDIAANDLVRDLEKPVLDYNWITSLTSSDAELIEEVFSGAQVISPQFEGFGSYFSREERDMEDRSAWDFLVIKHLGGAPIESISIFAQVIPEGDLEMYNVDDLRLVVEEPTSEISRINVPALQAGESVIIALGERLYIESEDGDNINVTEFYFPRRISFYDVVEKKDAMRPIREPYANPINLKSSLQGRG